jgi:hypothetical protein
MPVRRTIPRLIRSARRARVRALKWRWSAGTVTPQRRSSPRRRPLRLPPLPHFGGFALGSSQRDALQTPRWRKMGFEPSPLCPKSSVSAALAPSVAANLHPFTAPFAPPTSAAAAAAAALATPTRCGNGSAFSAIEEGGQGKRRYETEARSGRADLPRSPQARSAKRTR